MAVLFSYVEFPFIFSAHYMNIPLQHIVKGNKVQSSRNSYGFSFHFFGLSLNPRTIQDILMLVYMFTEFVLLHCLLTCINI